jgi:Spy/CpxP family protein refolding chaperone
LAVGMAQLQGAHGQDRKSSSSPDTRDARPAPRPPFKWWAIDKYKQELKLTSDQSAEIEKIFQASMERLRVDKDDLDRAQTSFSQLMEKPSAGEREFARAVDQLELARYNVSKERTMMLVRIHNILTTEQRKGLEAIRKRNEAEKDRQH